MTSLDAEFQEWLSRVYSKPPVGEQASQIEMAFYAGAVACGYVLKEVGGLTIESASVECAVAIDGITQSIRAHAVRMQQNGLMAVKH